VEKIQKLEVSSLQQKVKELLLLQLRANKDKKAGYCQQNVRQR